MKYSLIAALLLALLGLCACNSQPQAGVPGEYRRISAAEAREMLGEDGVILMDVRTPAEYAESRIPGALLIPDTELGDRAATELPDRDAVILLYCRSGRRSERAACELLAAGYTAVYDFGGILDWPYETEP